jgi:hypothetical protein
MAKSTTTTKAKTKTTKKSAARTAAAKTTKSSVKAKTTKSATSSKKTVAKKAPTKVAEVKKTAVKRSVTVGKFNRGFVFAGVILAVQAVLSVVLMKADSAQVFLGHLTKNELASRAGTVLAPAAHPFYEFEIRWVLAVVLGVSAIFAVLRGTKFLAVERAGLKSRVQKFRWLDIAVTYALVFELVALLNGVQDLIAIKLGMIAIALGAYFAWMHERQNTVSDKAGKANLVAASISFAVPVLAVIGTMWGTVVYGLVRSPWYAYAAAALLALGLLAVLLNLKRSANVSEQYYAKLDSMYNVQSLVVKVLLGVALIVGLYAK